MSRLRYADFGAVVVAALFLTLAAFVSLCFTGGRARVHGRNLFAIEAKKPPGARKASRKRARSRLHYGADKWDDPSVLMNFRVDSRCFEICTERRPPPPDLFPTRALAARVSVSFRATSMPLSYISCSAGLLLLAWEEAALKAFGHFGPAFISPRASSCAGRE